MPCPLGGDADTAAHTTANLFPEEAFVGTFTVRASSIVERGASRGVVATRDVQRVSSLAPLPAA
jgi:hypothetical protein